MPFAVRTMLFAKTSCYTPAENGTIQSGYIYLEALLLPFSQQDNSSHEFN